MNARGAILCAAALAAPACNVPPPPPSTGGAHFDDGGALDSDAAPAHACDRGVSIVESDYRSTNVVVSSREGVTLSASFVSSGATKPGLALALSGDVDVPFVRPMSNRLVILDRFGTNVVTWMDVESGSVVAQLPVGQGFESNPHDYLDVDTLHAFISRYGSNVTPGRQPFDQGGDLLIVDTQVPAIVGRVAMPEENPALLPCPGGINWLGQTVVVTLERWSRDFTTVGDGRLVGVSPETNEIVWTVDLPGLSACGRVAVSPDGRRAAIACSGRYDFNSKRFDTSHSDVVLFDATLSPPAPLQRFAAAARFDAGMQPMLAFASDATLVGVALDNASGQDRAFTLDVESGELGTLLAKNASFALGGLRCAPGCNDFCLLCDADTRVLHRWHFTGPRSSAPLADAPLESVIGLPPRTMGGL